MVLSPAQVVQGEQVQHPLLAPTTEVIGDRVLLANDVFRIVHDVFGHEKEGVGFGPSGEDNAWHSHVRMYSPLAAKAMTTETRGQNSWVTFGPHGEANRTNQKATVYAEQKATLLPEDIVFDGIEEGSAGDELQQSNVPPDARRLNKTFENLKLRSINEDMRVQIQEDQRLLPGVYAVPVSATLVRTPLSNKSIPELAKQIEESGAIMPLLIGFADGEGDAGGYYVMEGMHRANAL
jgi:hypothetical protein